MNIPVASGIRKSAKLQNGRCSIFDLLWLNGQDLREQPLVERKERLRTIVSKKATRRILYVDHVVEHGRALFDQVCTLDLEGIVAKPSISPYQLVAGRSPWIKIRNAKYTQTQGRGALFNRR